MRGADDAELPRGQRPSISLPEAHDSVAALLPGPRSPAGEGSERQAMQRVAAARWTAGVTCIVVVALIWSFASVLVQHIFLTRSFFRPFFLTYISNSLFIVNLPLWRAAVALRLARDPHAPPRARSPRAAEQKRWAWREVPFRRPSAANGHAAAAHAACCASRCTCAHQLLGQHGTQSGGAGGGGAAECGAGAGGGAAAGEAANGATIERESEEPRAPEDAPRARVTYVGVLGLALRVCPVWFAANACYNASLGMTSVTSSTLISTTSTLFTFVLSLLFIGERYSVAKLGGVALCMAGNALTAYADHVSGGASADGVPASALGDAICLLGAFLYGAYTVLLRRLIPDDEAVSFALFFGCLGTANALALGPVVALLHATRIEPLDSMGRDVLAMLCVKGLLDNVLSDFLWAKAVVLTSPTVATVGLSLTIPIAMASDWALHGIAPTVISAGAALCVCGGFVLINVSSQADAGLDSPAARHSRADIDGDAARGSWLGARARAIGAACCPAAAGRAPSHRRVLDEPHSPRDAAGDEFAASTGGYPASPAPRARPMALPQEG